tara:strand:+ start:92 stop:541 length:450 start_codon:yes stop_codon:yes gene_type:complete
MEWNVYLSGEIHTKWREEIKQSCKKLNLPIEFTEPITNHELSDNCGAEILGQDIDKFWKDHKSAKLNSIRIKSSIEQADIVIIRFGEKYKQWNVAFDAGYAYGLSKPIIVIHQEEHQHALKEIDAVALAVTKNIKQVVRVLQYTIKGEI